MAKVLMTTSTVTTSVWHMVTGRITRAMSNFSENVQELRGYTFEE